jgi:Tfp pilus assembly protein PilN
MITINLLPWREMLRRKRRCLRIVGWALVISLLLIMAVLGRWHLAKCYRQWQPQVSVLRSSLYLAKQQRQALDGEIAQQAKRLQNLQQQQHWRDQFACNLAWLSELANKLPGGVQIEKLSVDEGGVQMVVKVYVGILLNDIMQAMASIELLQKIRVHQLNSKAEQNLINVEIDAIVKCK